MMLWFKGKHGGSHPKENKDRTRGLAIEQAAVPDELIYPVSMHIGAPAKPVVEVGSLVKIGTVLAEAGGKVSAPVHASVSGEVVEIGKRLTLNGPADCIVVRNDRKDEMEVHAPQPGHVWNAGEILEAVRQAGIVGMGGATFPTAVKLEPPPGSVVDTLIINGAECEPYSTSDHRVMLEYTEEVISGIHVCRTLFPKLRQVFIAIEDNKPDAIEKMRAAVSAYGDVVVQPMHAMYPRGAEKNLIRDLTGREVAPGALPADVRCVVLNVSTTRAIHRAVTFGEPLYQRVVSVSGTPVVKPKNLLVRIGTPVASLLEDCGGFNGEVGKLLAGGPMMGKTLSDGVIPVTKGMTAITALTPKEAGIGESTDCIMCSECLNVCPVDLQPILISEAYERGDIDKSKELGAMDCIECGNCTYICPARIPLLDNIRSAKAAIKAKQEKVG